MRMKFSNILKVFLLVAVLPTLAFAQRGTVSGKILDANTGDPLPGASVLVEGFELGGATNASGEFTIEGVPAGERKLIARFIGYKSQSQTVRVSGGITVTVNFNLKETVLQLDEVVVTGAGIASEKKRLGNTVATINAQQLEDAPVSSVSEMLTGREAGVSVLPSGGLVGEGARIRIRGTSSLSTSNEPIVYVDGVRVDNYGGFAGDINAGGGGVPSRLDDINPEAIERIEILKGAAAATLYGTQASNGIIQIFTKKGQFGKPRFTFEVEQSSVNFPDAYKPNVGFARNDSIAGVMSQVLGETVQPFQLVSRNWVSDQFNTGWAQSYNMSVSGGAQGVTYFASGRFQHTDGPVNFNANNFGGLAVGGADDVLRRGQFSANVNIVPTNNLSIRFSTLYSNVNQNTIQNNNNIFAPLSLAQFGKPEFVAENNPLGQAAFATVREASFQEVSDKTDHAAISLNVNYRVTDEITVDATGGLDFVSQRSSEFRPFGWNVDGFASTDADGLLQLGKREHQEWTVDVKANWNRNFGSNFSSTFLAGFQGFNTINNTSFSDVDVFPGPGLEVLDAAANQTTLSRFSEVINAGFFVQEQVGYKDYLFVTGGVRFDANSAFGTDFSTQSYPKVSLSFVPTSAFDVGGSFLSTFRIRGAVGQSGQQPGAFDQFTTFEPYNAETGAGVRPENLGNPGIKPEVSTEFEAGFEAGFFSDRLGVEATYWDRTVQDALIARQFPPSGGFRRTQLDNIGELQASGLDLLANVSVLKKENVSIEFFANAAYLTEEITDLGGAPEQKAEGSYSRIRNYLREGYEPGAFFGARLADGEYPIDIDNDNVADSRDDLLAFFFQHIWREEKYV